MKESLVRTVRFLEALNTNRSDCLYKHKVKVKGQASQSSDGLSRCNCQVAVVVVGYKFLTPSPFREIGTSSETRGFPQSTLPTPNSLVTFLSNL